MKQIEVREVLGPRATNRTKHSSKTLSKLSKLGMKVCPKCNNLCSDQDFRCKKCKLRLKYDSDFKLCSKI